MIQPATNSEAYLRFKTESANKLKKLSNGCKILFLKEASLMGTTVFENELKFKRALSVMGCLYASTHTCVMQLKTDRQTAKSIDNEFIDDKTDSFCLRAFTQPKDQWVMLDTHEKPRDAHFELDLYRARSGEGGDTA